MEQFANLTSTTLNGSINNSVTSLTVTSAAGFPTSGNFRILIDSEIMLVTAVSGTIFTVTRGTEGTTAVSHTNLAPIACILTEDAIQSFRSDNVQTGTASLILTTPIIAGRLLLPSDIMYCGEDLGSSFNYFTGIQRITPPPALASFTWVNQGTATATQNNGVINLTSPGINAYSRNILVVSAPGTPYILTAYLIANYFPQDFVQSGLCFRESSTSKTIMWYMIESSGINYLIVTYYTSDTTAGTNLNSGTYATIGLGQDLYWWRLRNDGTNIYFDYSIDGVNFLNLYSEAKGAHFTTGPDQIGFFAAAENEGTGTLVPSSTSILSWDIN